MKDSILHFSEKGIKNLQKAEEKFANHPDDIAGYIETVRNEVVHLGLEIIKETLENFDEMFRASQKRKERWEIVRRDEKQLITSLGTVCFSKTLFRNKQSRQSKYLLDDFLHLDAHQRMTEDATAQLLREAADTSYRRGGEAVSLTDFVSKETVKDVLHKLEFPCKEKPTEKKQVEYLYIDADEDHVSLQFQNKKGDLEKDAGGYKRNGILTKLVYIYEGIEKDAPHSKRYHLVNPHYFCGTYEGKNNETLWNQIYQYIEEHYETDKIKKIFLNADGGSWIKAGKNRIKGITYVLDEFHMRKYLTKMTRHMLDSADEVRAILCNTIKNGSKEDFREGVKVIAGYEKTESGRRSILKAGEYFLSNWTAARLRLTSRDIIKGCSAEGHVSHVLSARMSSRPMGWSRTGADKMAQLRAYEWNHGDMLALAKYQRKEEKSIKKKEPPILGYREVMKDLYKRHSETEKYAEVMRCSVSEQIRKHIHAGLHSYIGRLL